MEILPIVYEGLAALALQDSAIRLVVLPGWGGKIASLFDRRRGREWLHRNPHFPYRYPAYAANYVQEFDIGGFDECFPNIGAGPYPTAPWESVALPDHGEVWSLPWQAVVDAEGITLSVEGVRLPYRMEKRLALRPDGLWIDYAVVNRSASAMPVIWSSHPLVEIRPGMRLHVPATEVRIEGCSETFTRAFGGAGGDKIAWTPGLSVIPGPAARMFAKLTARHLTAGEVGISDPAGGAALTFRFDPGCITNLGLWMNFGGWAGKPGAAPYYNLGLEPCIGGADRLDQALAEGEARVIPAGGTITWRLQVILD